MKITEHLFKVAGVEYGTNSNVYAISYDGGILLIDCGYQKEQWERMERCMEGWGLAVEEVTHVFLTHSHFDHAGNVWRVNRQGAKVLSSARDAEKIEHGNPEMEKLFGAKWICGKVDEILREGQRFEFPGAVAVQVLETPGHSGGSLSFLVEVDGVRAICTGDMFFVTPKPPEDSVGAELGYMGSEDFDLQAYVRSLGRLLEMEFDLLLPGHYYFYRGELAKEVVREAYEKALEVEKDGHTNAKTGAA